MLRRHLKLLSIHIYVCVLSSKILLYITSTFLGTKIELLHLKRTEQCRDGEQIEELKPIDKNLQYDFNFQQTIHIDEVIVKPVSEYNDLHVFKDQWTELPKVPL